VTKKPSPSLLLLTPLRICTGSRPTRPTNIYIHRHQGSLGICCISSRNRRHKGKEFVLLSSGAQQVQSVPRPIHFDNMHVVAHFRSRMDDTRIYQTTDPSGAIPSSAQPVDWLWNLEVPQLITLLSPQRIRLPALAKLETWQSAPGVRRSRCQISRSGATQLGRQTPA
jgi:hypothetical protein